MPLAPIVDFHSLTLGVRSSKGTNGSRCIEDTDSAFKQSLNEQGNVVRNFDIELHKLLDFYNSNTEAILRNSQIHIHFSTSMRGGMES